MDGISNTKKLKSDLAMATIENWVTLICEIILFVQKILFSGPIAVGPQKFFPVAFAFAA